MALANDKSATNCFNLLFSSSHCLKRLNSETPKLTYLLGQAINIDINNEITTERTYLHFAKAFNKNHISWLNEHDGEKLSKG